MPSTFANTLYVNYRDKRISLQVTKDHIAQRKLPRKCDIKSQAGQRQIHSALIDWSHSPRSYGLTCPKLDFNKPGLRVNLQVVQKTVSLAVKNCRDWKIER
jgi:hypothetical protein